MKNHLIFNLFVFFIFFIETPAFAAERLSVFVSVLPQKYFVEQIGGESVHVKVMVMPGASPATYEPKPSQMTALSNAKLYFSIGVPFEQTWLKKIVTTNPDMKLIKTDQGIEKLPMEGIHSHSETEHHQKTHKNESHLQKGLDPHIWLSPKLVKIQSRVILNALVKEAPSKKEIFNKNYQAFLNRIDALDKRLLKLFEKKESMGFMVFHPSWGYFASAYGLKQVPIEIEGKTPKPFQLKTLIQHARENGINVVFVQPQFSTKSAMLIAKEIKGQIVFADPLAENWEENMDSIAKKFKEALR